MKFANDNGVEVSYRFFHYSFDRSNSTGSLPLRSLVDASYAINFNTSPGVLASILKAVVVVLTASPRFAENSFRAFPLPLLSAAGTRFCVNKSTSNDPSNRITNV